jgi:hypothetical protein
MGLSSLPLSLNIYTMFEKYENTMKNLLGKRNKQVVITT